MTAPDQPATLDPATTPSSPAQPTAADSSSASAREAAVPGDAKKSEELLEAAKKDAAENFERYLRAVADLENLRRRTVREKDELRQFAAGRVLEDLLPILDNLALGLAAAKAPNADLKNLIGGISMVQEQLRSALNNHGLKEINPTGQKFDPNLHESISSQPSADVPEGSVAQVVRVGYSLNGRVLRPASVVVSSGPSKETGKPAS